MGTKRCYFGKIEIKVNYNSSNSPYYVPKVDVEFTGFGIKPIPMYPPTIFEYGHLFLSNPKFRDYNLNISEQKIKQALILMYQYEKKYGKINL